MTQTVYIETSVISYLTARPSRDLVIAGHQQTTQDWWETRRASFDLYVSDLVLKEAGGGDPQAASERLKILNEIELLEITQEALDLAQALVEKAVLPQKASADALHIAVAFTNGVDFLLTWNCKHIANATMRGRIEAVSRDYGCQPSVICLSLIHI